MSMRSSGAHGRGVANLLRLGKGNIAGEGNHEAQVERPPWRVSTWPVKQCRTPPRPVGSPVFAQSDAGSRPRRSRPFCDGRQWMMIGSLAALRQLHLLDEDTLLHFARRVIVEVIETNLSPGDYLWVAAPVAPVRRSRLGLPALLHGDGCRSSRRSSRLSASFDGAVEGSGSRAVAVADGNNRVKSRASERVREPLRDRARTVAFEMSVGVDEHRPSRVIEWTGGVHQRTSPGN